MKAKTLHTSILVTILSWMAVFSLPSFAYNVGDQILAKSKEGIELRFIITSLSPKECEVGNYGRDVSGVLTIPENVEGFSITKIADGGFSGCRYLTSIIIPKSVKSFGHSAFDYCLSLTSITIPNSVSNIGEYAFYKCISLTSIDIPNSVTSIGNSAFFRCSNLTSVTIPNSVTSIGVGAFRQCLSLKEVRSKIKSPFTIRESTFSTGFSFDEETGVNVEVLSSATLYVPKGTKEQYLATGGWKNFNKIENHNNIVEIEYEAAGKITFVDPEVKKICIRNWDTSLDGKLSETEAAAVKDLGNVFWNNKNIKSFNELQYFTGLKAIGKEAFCMCSGLTSITIPNSVTTLEVQAFYSCRGLTSISIPNSVTSIEGNAFLNCTGLTSVTIPNSVTSIGNGAFMGCSGLTSVAIPNSITSIRDAAFKDCSGLTSVYISDLEAWCKISFSNEYSNPLYYAHHLYLNGEEIKQLVIPNSVTSIGSIAFGGCSALTSVTIPNSVTNIGSYAFYDCSGLTSVTIPNSVTSIGDGVFLRCAGLTAITIPNSVTRIESNAFNSCSSLTSITIPNSVTSIGNYAFGDCSNLQEIHSLIEKPFAIPENVFNTYDATTLHVPAGTKAKYQATEGWKNFKNIVEEGGETAKIITFADAEVKHLCVQNWDTNGDGELSEDEAAAVTDLGEVFKNNKTIKTFNELQYFTGLTTIRSYAFYYCSGLTSITIPNSVTSLGRSAFYNCSSLTSVTIPNSVTSIGDYTFYKCSGLTSVTIPNSVTSIGRSAFENCSGLTSVTIPNSVTSIGNSAFENCSGLTSVTIPNSVTSIGGNAFWECAGIASIIVEGGNPAYDSRNNCNAIINTSNNELITGCKNTIIPNTVTSIGRVAFYGCTGLTSITIPNSVTSIIENAFGGCSGLQEVHSLIEQPFAIDENVFDTYDTATLYVPKGTKAKYQATDGWKNFKTIMQEGGDPDDVTLTANSYTREYGEENPTFGYEVTSGTITSGQPTLSCSATKTSPVGTYDIVIQTGTVSNKTVNLVKGTLTITKAPLTISAGSYTKEEGQDNPEFTLNYTGFKNGETKSVLTKQPTVSCNATKDSPVGTYTVTVSDAEAQNYHISYVNGSLTITPKPVVSKNITFADAEVKRICVQNWDTNGDGELSEAEAAAVTDLGTVFKDNKAIRTFHELKYFTNLNSIKDYAFQGCSNLTEMTIPATITSVGENAFNDAGLLSLIWESNTMLTAKLVERLKEARPNILIFVKDEDVMPSKGIDNVVINGVAESLVLTENSPFHSIQTFTAQSATFSHRFTMETGKGASAGWETIALPFDVQVYRHESKGEVVPFAKYTEGSKAKPFWLYRLTSGGFVEAQAIEANKPYLISMPNNASYYDEDCLNGKVQFTASSVTIKRTDEAEMTNVSYEGKTLRPTFAAVDRGSTVYAINATGDFSTATGGGTAGSLFVRDLRAVRPFEAYFDSGSANAREFITINFADETATGIDSTFDVPRSMVNGQRSMVNVYNMAGQLVYSGSTEGLNAMKQQLPAGLYVVSSPNGVSRVRAY